MIDKRSLVSRSEIDRSDLTVALEGANEEESFAVSSQQ
jgi:hypothetical protein